MRPFAFVVAFAVVGTPLGAQRAAAPSPSCVPQSLSDTPREWNAIARQYARLADAMRRKDLDALFALYTPDYHVVMANGEVWSRERSLAYQRNGLARVLETYHISNSIVKLTGCDGHATATVLQQWYRTQNMNGASHRVETNAVQDEAWSLEPDGWKRGDISEIRRGASFVDGKRVDITKPYDPAAPAYDPDAALLSH
jgi:ketosteroid isomerase-like protein